MAVYLNNLRRVQQYQVLIVLANRRRERPQRGLVDRMNPFEKYRDGAFKSRFRLTKPTAIYLCQLLEGELTHPTSRSNAVPVHLQVLAALRFFACGE